jgi:hypothetical protein
LREYNVLINGNTIQVNDLDGLQKGVYLLSFDLGGDVYSRKVFKF